MPRRRERPTLLKRHGQGVVVGYDGQVLVGPWPNTTQMFEISIAPQRFGVIEKICLDVSPDAVGKRCFEVIAGWGHPCSGCPAKAPLPAGVPVINVNQTSRGNAFVSRALRIDHERASITAIPLESQLLTRLVLDRLRGLHGQLSARECEVLEHLMFGASLDEIASTLKISTRTVRFHQANILDKLGLESRLQLWVKLLDLSSAIG